MGRNMRVSVKYTGVAEALRALSVPERELQFAISSSLNNLAFLSRDYLSGTMPQYIDRPTTFTKGGVLVEKATKSTLRSRVFLRKEVASYLIWQIEGGIRYPPGRAIPVPVNITLDRYGNMRRRTIPELLASSASYFSGTVRGVEGIWQRYQTTENVGGTINIYGGGVKLIVAWEPKAQYSADRWPMLTKGVEHAQLNWKYSANDAAQYVLDKMRRA